MSSYIVSDKTIDRILTYLHSNSDKLYLQHFKWNKEPEFSSFEKLGRDLLVLNRKAVYQRYDNNEAKLLDSKHPEDYHWQEEKCSIYQFLKSLQCLKYQCSEGNIPKTKLYKFLREIEKATINRIINELKEYQDADWG